MASETLEMLMQAAPIGLEVILVIDKVHDVQRVCGVRDVHVWTLTKSMIVGLRKVDVLDLIRGRDQLENGQWEFEKLLQDVSMHKRTLQVYGLKSESEECSRSGYVALHDRPKTRSVRKCHIIMYSRSSPEAHLDAGSNSEVGQMMRCLSYLSVCLKLGGITNTFSICSCQML